MIAGRLSRRLDVVAGCGLIWATASSSAVAAGPWSSPTTVSAAHTFIARLDADSTPAGTIASWSWQDGIGDTARVGAAAAGSAGATKAFNVEHRGPRGLLAVAAYGRTRALALSHVQLTRSSQRYRVAYAFGRIDGRFGASRTLLLAPTAYLPQLAAAPNGTALIAFVEHISHRRRAVRVAVRQAGGMFGAVTTLSGRGQADTVVAAAGSRGDLAIVFARNGRLLARVRRAGHHWGSIRELDRADGPTRWAPRVLISDHGRVEVIWRRHRFTHNGVAGVRALYARYMPAASFVFSAVQHIERDGVAGPTLVHRGRGFAIGYMYDDATTSAASPRVRVTAPTARMGAAHDAAPPSGGARGVAVTTDVDGLTAAWIQPTAGGNGDGVARAAVLAPGAPGFGDVEAVSPSEAAHEVVLTTDPATSEPVALWTARPDGTGPGIPIAAVRSVVRSARRSPPFSSTSHPRSQPATTRSRPER